MTVSAITLFCEDLREEKGGTESLIGVYPDNVNIPSAPGAFGKLVIYTRLAISTDENIEHIRVMMHQLDELERNIAEFDTEFLKKAKHESIDSGNPMIGIIARAIAMPYPISGPGQIIVRVFVDEMEITSGSLNIKVAGQSATDPTV